MGRLWALDAFGLRFGRESEHFGSGSMGVIVGFAGVESGGLWL
jgi:hypothetical protein